MSRLPFSRFALWLFTFLFSLAFMPLTASAMDDQKEVNYILKMETPPFGVVFEVIEGDVDALKWAIPQVAKFAKQLREKFPDIAIAVVTHGKEQFGLVKTAEKENAKLQTEVKSLVQNQDIPVHVCGTHASWYGKGEKDFPDYVDVTPAGPTQIANYEDMGYEKIVMDEPEEK
jgi:intracellular sulfur oxidation DsrE/DsrF family protein